MGITTNTANLIIASRNGGADYKNFAMIGRQQFFAFDFNLYRQIIAEYGLNGSEIDFADSQMFVQGNYTDDWFRKLGAETVVSFDANDYEGANHIHDFNQPIGSKFYKKYSIVFDGGSSEHIFNIPTAFSNYMKMIAVGGHYIGVLPCNQWGGHGFYQFNPELFYRCFSQENGFGETRVYTFHERGQLRLNLFQDPLEAGRRLEFQNQEPVSLFIMSKKVYEIEPFSQFPQQSDYENLTWQK